MSEVKDYIEDEYETDEEMDYDDDYDISGLIEHRNWVSIDNDQKTELVFLSNMLIRNREFFGLDIYQAKMLYYLISKIKREDTVFNKETISFVDYMHLMGIPRAGSYYAAIDASISKLMHLQFSIIDEAENKTKYYRWIQSGCVVDRENRLIHIQLDHELKQYLLNLDKEFTAFELGFICDMKNKYAIRLYEYLHSMRNLNKPVNIKKERFVKEFADNKYGKSFEILNRVIIPALNEINAVTDLTVDCIERKKKARNGKYMTAGYSFVIKPKNWKDREAIIDTWNISPDKKSEMKSRGYGY